eukprot:GHVS01001681.1.p1 GENE.GHVS01001681.1~~GHVS01001681.1.p1  ORF type:complete len:767 (+),score=198.49 GHVS01001681.1:253-2301(+)
MDDFPPAARCSGSTFSHKALMWKSLRHPNDIQPNDTTTEGRETGGSRIVSDTGSSGPETVASQEERRRRLNFLLDQQARLRDAVRSYTTPLLPSSLPPPSNTQQPSSPTDHHNNNDNNYNNSNNDNTKTTASSSAGGGIARDLVESSLGYIGSELKGRGEPEDVSEVHPIGGNSNVYLWHLTAALHYDQALPHTTQSQDLGRGTISPSSGSVDGFVMVPESVVSGLYLLYGVYVQYNVGIYLLEPLQALYKRTYYYLFPPTPQQQRNDSSGHLQASEKSNEAASNDSPTARSPTLLPLLYHLMPIPCSSSTDSASSPCRSSVPPALSNFENLGDVYDICLYGNAFESDGVYLGQLKVIPSLFSSVHTRLALAVLVVSALSLFVFVCFYLNNRVYPPPRFNRPKAHRQGGLQRTTASTTAGRDSSYSASSLHSCYSSPPSTMSTSASTTTTMTAPLHGPLSSASSSTSPLCTYSSLPNVAPRGSRSDLLSIVSSLLTQHQQQHRPSSSRFISTPSPPDHHHHHTRRSSQKYYRFAHSSPTKATRPGGGGVGWWRRQGRGGCCSSPSTTGGSSCRSSVSGGEVFEGYNREATLPPTGGGDCCTYSKRSEIVEQTEQGEEKVRAIKAETFVVERKREGQQGGRRGRRRERTDVGSDPRVLLCAASSLGKYSVANNGSCVAANLLI